ncbi:cell envelope integrity protein CreD [Mucilaginibacter paludis]|uniref:Inner membrane CreD family protein n=1 Tax=Mucilaginibacter paludis DSM 18603 TaxID=714943 RepID=H1YGN9_9SPHI|nr:cell envelope integrity protein CreD [Mucilaginibacter paludis]EHQ25425.1 Inner membrane CreD family protein [Mucilaginibacter paludis DSM 18603]
MIQEIENQKRVSWFKESVIVKLSIIAALILLLLIPSAWIQNLITEREGTHQQVLDDISNNWSGSQLIQGPILIVPYKREIKELDSNKKEVIRLINETLYVLPQNLNIKANVITDVLHRGIFDAVVFNSKVLINGNFGKLELVKQGIDPSWVQYDKVRLVFSISDLKGLKSNPVLQLNGQKFTAEPDFGAQSPLDKGLQVSFSLPKDDELNFNFDLDLKGSDELSFLHTGKTTNVEVSSSWLSPKFDGRYLPDTRIINKSGFSAKWRMLYYNRPFPQQWVNDMNMLTGKKIDDAIFGVKLRLPVDQYQKTMRTTKYSTLVILLTFVSLFFTELIRKQRIHVFNYILIGAAMVIYYTLLLSFSEQLGYNLAYLIASVATITLIAAFTSSLLKNKQVALLFGFILSTLYGFIFILIQLEQLSLMIGSILLFIVISLLMYFSRKINWEKH